MNQGSIAAFEARIMYYYSIFCCGSVIKETVSWSHAENSKFTITATDKWA